MRDPRILRVIFLFLGEVQQHIEAGEILVAFNHGVRLLVLQHIQLVNGGKKGLDQPLPFHTKCAVPKARLPLNRIPK